ncbi:MAG: ATP synthase subunit I [Thiotrichaceae bacterium]
MRSLIIIQVILILIGASGFVYYMGEVTILASFFGGAVAIVNTLLLSWRLQSAAEMADNNPDGGVLTLYLGVIQRFIFVLVMFGIGMGVLKLNPPAMLGTFALAQLAYMIYGSKRAK